MTKFTGVIIFDVGCAQPVRAGRGVRALVRARRGGGRVLRAPRPAPVAGARRRGRAADAAVQGTGTRLMCTGPC